MGRPGARKSGSLDLMRGTIRTIAPKGAGGFEILTPNAKADAKGTDFFFIYENKSTSLAGHESLNYEFLHKTFSEFLAADFLLRVAVKRCSKDREILNSDYIFRFCFGYNWLNKHHNVEHFLFEQPLIA